MAKVTTRSVDSIDRVSSLFQFDREHARHGCLVGIDEAGRGPWAGPVVAAAVCLPPDLDLGPLRLLDDSKKLTPARREKLAAQIQAQALAYGIGQASPREIERLDIEKASFLAMKRALIDLGIIPDRLLIDGHRDPVLGLPTECIVKGDSLSASIAAASILAKTSRDRQMEILGGARDPWGFGRHKGYGTQFHQHALAVYGVSEHHRKTFKPVARCLEVSGPSEDFRKIMGAVHECTDREELNSLFLAVDRAISHLATSECWLLREEIERKAKSLSKPARRKNLRKKGADFEKVVDQFLTSRGYNILERNYHGGQGEIDLIARDGETLVFIEVKMRNSSHFGEGFDAVDARKRNRIVRTALDYLSHLDREEDCRFDIVSISRKEAGRIEVEHLPNAFTPGEDFWL